jgi:hypothetical protein
MARRLITPIVINDMSTVSSSFHMSSDAMVKCSTGANGAYVKTSDIDASRLIFVIQRTSKSGSSMGRVIFRAGDREGVTDTKRDLSVIANKSSVAAGRYVNFIHPSETRRFIDSDGYIKIDFSTGMSSGGGTSHRVLIGAIYVKP